MTDFGQSSAPLPPPCPVRWRRWLRRASLAAVALAALAVAAWWLLPKPPLLPEALSYSRAMTDSSGQLLHLTISRDGRYRLPVSLGKISPDVLQATLYQEDRHFFRHPGFNPLSLVRATWGLVSGQRLGGGSTLTMQFVRLRYGLNTRSIPGKAVQIFRAVQIERHYSKREVLEAYLTLAPYGANVEGIAAASALWCGKSPDQLTRREAIALSVLPQSPAARSPRRAANNPALMQAQARLAARLQAENGWRSDPLDAGFCLQRRDTPRKAPHLCRRLEKSSAEEAAPLATTLDETMQDCLVRELRTFLAGHRDWGMDNGAALLVHAPSREVRAYVGSADFFSEKIGGQIDGIGARRSSGSLLKPFVYALAMDQGLIHPRSLLDDAPRRFAEYQPENADRGFLGPVPAAEALWRSRNVPAIALADELKDGGFYSFLRSAGVALKPDPSVYGLTLTLGGAEVSIEEAARLYCLLADDGVNRPLRFLKTSAASAEPSPVPLLTPAARFLTLKMLQPDGQAQSGLAWKTGTSHGFRDAWAAGVFGDHVLIVWLGHFDGHPLPHVFARNSAAPLLFRMFASLQLPRVEKLAPASVAEVEVCAVSGALPGKCCQHLVRSGFIPGVSPIATCQIHRDVWIDGATGLRVNPGSSAPGVRREVREFWPAHQLALFRQAGVPRQEAPAWAPDARAHVSETPPRITSPQSRLTYSQRSGDPSRNAIPLVAEAAPGVKSLNWFAGGRFLGSSAPARPLLWAASPGTWTLRAVDESGRSATCHVRVERVD